MSKRKETTIQESASLHLLSTEKTEKKLSLEEYQSKYMKKQNSATIHRLLRLIILFIGAILFTCCISISLRVYEINVYAGYVTGAVLFVLFVVLFVVPTLKIKKTGVFLLSVNEENVSHVQKHNRILRDSIADKMISYTAEVQNSNWYRSELIGQLAIAKNTGNDSQVQKILTEIYETDVKKTAKKIISVYSMRAGVTSALSQSATLDILLVATYNMQLIKELVFLYGFRPTDAQLTKIYATVVQNSLISYGIQNYTTGIGQMAAGKLGTMAESIPVLGKAISTLAESTAQGIVNGMLTFVIGYQTIKYLAQEYHLQSILDTVVFDMDKDFEIESKQMKKELMEATKDAMKKDQKEINNVTQL